MKPSSLPESLGQLLAAARARLADPREAAILVTHALGISRTTLYAHLKRAVSAAEAKHALELVERRAAGVPVAYLTGEREFYGLPLTVTPDVLIPRPETELLVELALARLRNLQTPVIADLGTGSGAIALAIAHARPDARVLAVDRSDAALAVAATNRQALSLNNVTLVHGDWLAPLRPDGFDLIVSNPPYVASGDPHLDAGDLRFEPRQALVSGPDGLNAIRRLITEARAYLRPGGSLILEHGAEQQEAICAILAEYGYANIGTHSDLASLPRAITALSPDDKRGS